MNWASKISRAFTVSQQVFNGSFGLKDHAEQADKRLKVRSCLALLEKSVDDRAFPNVRGASTMK